MKILLGIIWIIWGLCWGYFFDEVIGLSTGLSCAIGFGSPIILALLAVVIMLIFAPAAPSESPNVKETKKPEQYELISSVLMGIYRQYNDMCEQGYSGHFRELSIHILPFQSYSPGKMISFTIVFSIDIDDWVLKYLKDDYISYNFKKNEYDIMEYTIPVPVFNVPTPKGYRASNYDHRTHKRIVDDCLALFLAENPNAKEFVSKVKNNIH